MLKIGVLGAGDPGKMHISLLKEIQAFELLGFFDPDPELAGKIAAELGVKAWSSAEELIAAADVIDITTPTISHFEYAEKAIRKSKHVFIEKPLAHTVNEGKTLLQLATEANVKVQVGHAERFNPAFRAAQELLEKPMFIESHRLSEFNPHNSNIPVVLDLMIHDIDIVLSLVKANIRRISANGVPIVSQSPDIVNARIEFDNGAVANLTASRISLKHKCKSRFFRPDACISVDFLKKTVSVARMEMGQNEAGSPGSILDYGSHNQLKKIELENTKIGSVNAIQLELESFADSILNNTRPLVSIDDGLKALDVAHKIIEQLQMNTNFAAATQ